MRLVLILLAAAGTGLSTRGQAQVVWQADLQVRKVSVTGVKDGLQLHVLVGAELGEAMGSRLEILLPVGVGLLRMTPGCIPGPHPPGVSALRARVICRLGDLPARSRREVQVVITAPPPGPARRFGAVALSDTPDPRPGNNFAERELPESPVSSPSILPNPAAGRAEIPPPVAPGR